MKIATYNVNGINARLPVLFRWLEESSPDVICLLRPPGAVGWQRSSGSWSKDHHQEA